MSAPPSIADQEAIDNVLGMRIPAIFGNDGGNFRSRVHKKHLSASNLLEASEGDGELCAGGLFVSQSRQCPSPTLIVVEGIMDIKHKPQVGGVANSEVSSMLAEKGAFFTQS